MNNEEPQGGGIAVATPDAPVTPTTENVLDQASSVVAGAEASGGALPIEVTQPPTVENPSLGGISSIMGPSGADVSSTDGGSAILGQKTEEVDAHQVEDKKPGWGERIKNFFPIKATPANLTNQNNNTPTMAPEGQGVGFIPEPPKTDAILPEGANPNLDMVNGTTPSFPPEGQKVPQAPDAEATSQALPEQTTTALGTSEVPAPEVNPKTSDASATTQTDDVGAEATEAQTPVNEITQPSPIANVTTQEEVSSVASEMVDPDKAPAPEPLTTTSSESTDPLAVDKSEISIPEFTPSNNTTSAEVTESTLPDPVPSKDTPSSSVDSVGSVGDINTAPEEPKATTPESWHVDATDGHTDAPSVTSDSATTEEPKGVDSTTPAAFSTDAIQTTTPEVSPTDKPDASGNLAIETNPPVEPEASTDQWNASNMPGATPNAIESANTTTEEPITSTEVTPLDVAGTVETPTPLASNLPTTPETNADQPSDPSTTSLAGLNSSADEVGPVANTTPSSETVETLPDASIATPTIDNAIQTNGDYPGETATPKPIEQPIVPSAPDNVTPISPEVTVEPNGPGSGVKEGQEDSASSDVGGDTPQDQQQA